LRSVQLRRSVRALSHISETTSKLNFVLLSVCYMWCRLTAKVHIYGRPLFSVAYQTLRT